MQLFKSLNGDQAFERMQCVICKGFKVLPSHKTGNEVEFLILTSLCIDIDTDKCCPDACRVFIGDLLLLLPLPSCRSSLRLLASAALSQRVPLCMRDELLMMKRACDVRDGLCCPMLQLQFQLRLRLHRSGQEWIRAQNPDPIPGEPFPPSHRRPEKLIVNMTQFVSLSISLSQSRQAGSLSFN